MSNHFLILALAGVLFLLLLSCFFSSSETSLLATNRHKLRSQLRSTTKPPRSSKLLNRLLTRQDRILATILLGNNLSNILLSSLVTLITIRVWGEGAIVLSSIALTIVVLVFAEITPKNYALRNADLMARLYAYPLTAVDLLFKPFSTLVVKFANLLLSKDKRDKSSATGNYNLEDLRSVISDPSTMLSSRHRDVIISILDLDSMRAEDILVPKKELAGVDVSDLGNTELAELSNIDHSRLVVYDRDMDKVEGVVRMRTLLALSQADKLSAASIRKNTQKLPFVPETMPLLTLFSQLRSANADSCFVVDEHGAFQGLITLSDLLDELLGDMKNQGDELISKQPDGSYLIDGKVNIRAINRRLGWNLPHWQGVTLHGLIIERLENLPEANVCLRINNYLVQTVHIEQGFVDKAQLSAVIEDEEDL